MHLDKEHKFGVQDLDETHLFLYKVDQKTMALIQDELDRLHDKNTYELNQEGRDKVFRVDFAQN